MKKKEALTGIIGKDCVLDTKEELDAFSRDSSFANPIKPRFIVKPRNTDAVQKLVKWANETGTPLIPVSSGAPHFRGDTVPSSGGAIIVDLSGMKKILRIDHENRIAIVEPGITFNDLIPELEQKGLRLNMPLLPRNTKSLVGSLLEREPVTMPQYHWDLTDPLACTEIIYGNGDLFRTGSAAGPGDLEEQWEVGAAQNEASGPVQADFSRIIQGAQGTMGIVTWASIRCEHLPVLEEPFFIASSKLDSLLELCHHLINGRLVDDCLILNSTNLAHILEKEGSPEYETIRTSLPQWVLFYTITGKKYFPEEKVKYQIEDSSKHARTLGLEPVRQLGDASAYELLRILHGPVTAPHWKVRAKGSCYDIFFLSTSDRLSRLSTITKDLAVKNDYPVPEMGIYIQPQVQGVSYHCEYTLFFDPDDPSETASIRELSMTCFDPLANGGAFFSRPYGPWAEFAYRRDTQTTIGLRKLKNIFDPNNVMNPGKLCFYT